MVEVSTNSETPPDYDTAPPRDAPEESPVRARGKRTKWAMRLASLVFLCLFVTAGVAIGGFLKFAEDIASMTPPDEFAAVDAIVVLTGGAQRIDHAMSLFNRGIGERMLISGVNPATTGRQIMNFTEGSDALFECCVDIGHDAIDTIGNANETARWISRHEFDRVLVVTNDYHIPRSLLELRHVDPDTVFTAYPVTLSDLKSDNWLTRPDVLRTLINEYAKYSWARLRQAAGASVPSGLRTDLTAPAEGLVQAEMP